ncbi:MAG: hypothetical protein IH944_13215 [Armatimonadetes bacterium]|nr:hypothetical protein [Armatimonadota bacterium]
MFVDRDQGPGWRLYVFYAAMVALIFSWPAIMDDDQPVRLATVPYWTIAGALGVMWLGFLAVKRVDEWRSWAEDEQAEFKSEFRTIVLVTLASTVVGLILCDLLSWTYDALPFLMLGPWALLKLVQYIRRPRVDVWD